MEPGFYIVPRCMTYQEVLAELGAPQANIRGAALCGLRLIMMIRQEIDIELVVPAVHRLRNDP